MKKIIFVLIICFVMLSFATAVFAYQNPTANAGPDLYVASGQSVILQGSGYDPQNSSLAYYWNCSGGTLSSYTIAQPTFTAPSATNQNYACSLTVTNSYNLSVSDTMTVSVNSNQVGGLSVQTNSATNISNYQATLNGYLSIPYLSGTNYVWFQWGTTTGQENQTNQQTLNNSGSFSQNIANLSINTTYHFRAVAQNNGSTVYGQDMTFYTSGSGNYYGNGTLTVTKQVENLSAGILNLQPSVNANPSDLLNFTITLQARNQDVHNVYIRDILPANLIYRQISGINLTSNYSGNITSGINIGTIPANTTQIISYQAQVASAANFVYGTTTLTNNATITSTEAGSQTASASAIVNNTAVYGAATSVSTGLTNNPITDSFFLPILLIILMSYFYFSGNIYKFSDWLENKIK